MSGVPAVCVQLVQLLEEGQWKQEALWHLKAPSLEYLEAMQQAPLQNF
jgi:hypothetical protein